MSSSSINYLDYGTEGKFADDTKLGRTLKYSGEQGFNSEGPQQGIECHH